MTRTSTKRTSIGSSGATVGLKKSARKQSVVHARLWSDGGVRAKPAAASWHSGLSPAL